MIKIFRVLKANLIQEGKLSKYLLYALGEILLVVIGIIIAVQINNLIDQDKRNTLETETLLEIKANLEVDLIEIDDELWSYRTMGLYDSTLIAAIKQRLPFTDTLAAYAYTIEDNAHFNPTFSGYNLLESKGIDLVSNDSLRIQLTDLYERRYPYYGKYEEERIQIVQTLFKPYMIKNFYLEDSKFWTKRKRVPFNYEKLVKDPEWISIIQTNQGLASVLTIKALELKVYILKAHKRIVAFLNRQKDR